MTSREFELEVLAYYELTDILRGNKKPGPSSEFLYKAKQLLKQFEKGEPVTPAELGWDKDE